MLISKEDVISRLILIKSKYERGMYGLAVEVVDECLKEIEKLEETPPKFYLVDKGKK